MIAQLRKDVEQLAVPGGRMPGTTAHIAARQYIIARARETGLEGYAGGSFELPYGEGEIQLTNVIGRLPGRRPELPPVLIAAHYDTCGTTPGADDNASAIAIALSAVDPLRKARLDRSVLFAFFDAEEPPHFLKPTMGSTYFYEHQRREEIHCAIVLDLVGHDLPAPTLENALIILGMESDPGLEGVVRACDPSPGLSTLVTLNRYIGDMSDHHIFRINKRPYLFLTCAQWEHFHMPTDTPDKLNYEKMAHISAYTVRAAIGVASATLNGPFEGYDTTETELYFLRKYARPIADALGNPMLSRTDLESMVSLLASEGGLLTGR